MKSAEVFFLLISAGYSYIFLVVLHKLIVTIPDKEVRLFWVVKAGIVFLRQLWMMLVVAQIGINMASVGHSILTIAMMTWSIFYLNRRYGHSND